MRAIPSTIGALHFVGIGGIGMSGIAEVLHNLGYTVQGSDIADSANVKRLRALGIKVEVGHRAENLSEAIACVISTAVKPDNPEVAAARKTRVPVVRRAEMLAELMRLKWSVAIGGTHGKTTTTSLVAAVMEAAQLDPTVINGGIINAYGTNTRLGDGDWMVVEADESDGTFIRLPATAAVVTNIDPEHMDHYGDFDTLRAAFDRFVLNMPFYGFAAVCIDHPEVQAMIPRVADRWVVTYGFSPQADIRGVDLRTDAEGSRFTVQISERAGRDGEEGEIQDLFLPMYGEHNVQNALAAVTVAHEMGVGADAIRQAFTNFGGVKRRFTTTGVVNNIRIIDDYGHHPVEITAVLKAARQAVGSGDVIAVVQPHRYTRLADLFEEFCTCFNDADSVIVADVYEAGEEPIAGADKNSMVEGLRMHGHRDVQGLKGPEALPQLIADMAKPGDLVVCLGAGNITVWANDLPGQLASILNPATAQGSAL
ncbi:MAG: UDP-N-acetylmuramate--L-alanine ligase [Pseudomonadota bacterium]